MSVMIQDMLMTYKLGWKTSYYQNTYDLKVDVTDTPEEVEVTSESTPNSYEPESETTTPKKTEEECESCVL